MEQQISNLIKEINELAMQYSRGFITYEDYKARRSDILTRMEKGDSKSLLDQSGIMEMVNTVAGFIKRS